MYKIFYFAYHFVSSNAYLHIYILIKNIKNNNNDIISHACMLLINLYNMRMRPYHVQHCTLNNNLRGFGWEDLIKGED